MKRYLETNSILAALLMMQPTVYTNEQKQILNPVDIDVKPKQTKPAKGCKEYFFNEEGYYYDGENRRPFRKEEVVFYCHASNAKNAERKYNNWLKSKKHFTE